jgi:hypothetical protein
VIFCCNAVYSNTLVVVALTLSLFPVTKGGGVMHIHDTVRFAAITLAQAAELSESGKAIGPELRTAIVQLLNAIVTATDDEYARLRLLAEVLRFWQLKPPAMELTDATHVCEHGAENLVDPKLHAAIVTPTFWHAVRQQVRAAAATDGTKLFEAYRKKLAPKPKEPATPPKAPPPAPKP